MSWNEYLRNRHVVTLSHQKVGAFVSCICGYEQYAAKVNIAGAYIMAHRMEKFPMVRQRMADVYIG